MPRYSSSMTVFAGMLLTVSTAQAAHNSIHRSGAAYYTDICANVVEPFRLRCASEMVTDRTGKAFWSALAPVGGLTPSDLRDAYKIGTDGDSHTIVAIADAYGYTNAESDLAVYRSQFGLPACTTANGCFKKLNQQGEEGNYPDQDIHWAEESALDLDMASAMCPNCKLYLIESNTNAQSDIAAAVNTVAALGVHVISNSYVGSERGSQRYESAYNHPGIAVTASSGDSGYGVFFPASSPNVIAVGGTRLVRNRKARGWSETVWQGAGSGCSAVYQKPVWQHDPGCSKRMVSDVSAVADPATGVAVYGPNSNGISAWLILGGTSVGAPLIGGIYGNNGGAVNGAESTYKKSKKRLFDVKSGSNGTCSPAYFCTGEKGYDGPTGNGTPNGTGAFGD